MRAKTKNKKLEKRDKTGLERKQITGVGGFDPKTLSYDVIKYMKSSFDETFNNVVKIQDINEEILYDILDKGREVQADAVLMVNDFIENAKKGGNTYRKVMEYSFQSMAEILK